MIFLPTLVEIFISPYKLLAQQHYEGLVYIETNLPSITSFEELNNAVYDYVQGLYFPTADSFMEAEIKSIIPFAIDDYKNRQLDHYSGDQLKYIRMMMDEVIRLPESVPLISTLQFIKNMQNNFEQSGMSIEEQTPLQMALMIGVRNVYYWQSALVNPASNWYSEGYFSDKDYVNAADVKYWVLAALHGVFTGANKAKSYGLIDPPRIIGIDMVSALTASLGASVAKVMFKILPKSRII